MTAIKSADDVLAFWTEAGPEKWYKKDEDFDRTIRDTFLATYEAAAAGRLSPWEKEPDSALALVIVLDQFPRNMFRATPTSFGSDPLALSAAREAVARCFDRKVPALARAFFYFPFEHSEELADQDECVRLFAQWPNEPELASFQDYARRHREVIERFGRFPHRNAVLGRPSTPDETDFLRQPGSSF